MSNLPLATFLMSFVLVASGCDNSGGQPPVSSPAGATPTVPTASQQTAHSWTDGWPSILTPSPNNDHSTTTLPDASRLKDAALNDLGFTYGYCEGQSQLIARLKTNFPHLKGRLLKYETAFQARFGEGSESVIRILENSSPTWPATRETLKKTIASKLAEVPLDGNAADQMLLELERRLSAPLQSPAFETLLMYTPIYIKRPEMEMIDGFKKEFKSDGSGKAKGVKVAMQYPASWLARNGRRPNIVQFFTSENGRGSQTASIVVKDLGEIIPDGALHDLSKEEAEELLDVGMPGVQLLNRGRKMLCGTQKSVWAEHGGSALQAGSKLDVHMLTFAIPWRDKLVIVQLMTATSVVISNVSAIDMFRRHAPTFQLMINSFDIFNRYD